MAKAAPLPPPEFVYLKLVGQTTRASEGGYTWLNGRIVKVTYKDSIGGNLRVLVNHKMLSEVTEDEFNKQV